MVKTGLKIALSLILTGIFLWAAFRNVNWDALKQALENATPGWILLSGLIVILSCLPRAWRWQMLLKPVSDDISLKAAFWAVLMAYAGNNIFPRAGEFARVIAIKRDHPVSMSAVLATVVVERLLDMLVLVVMFGVVLFFARDEIARAFPDLESVGLIALPLIVFTLIGLGWLSARGERGLTLLETHLGRLSPGLAERCVRILRQFLQGMRAVHTVEGYAGIFFSTTILNLMYLLALYLPFYSFDFPQKYGLNPFDALVIMTISTVGIVIPTPGGTGTYHYFCKQTLHFFYGIPESTALAFATSIHGIGFLSFLAFGGPPLLRMMWSQKKEKREIT